MSNREEFEYEAGQELKLPVSIIKQARMGDGYDHAFDSMSVMQPLSQWWHWCQRRVKSDPLTSPPTV